MSMGDHAPTGENHYRQRRVLLPAFGPSESKAQIPVFRECAREVNLLVTLRVMTFGSHSPKLVQEFRSRVDSESHSVGFREENIPEFLSRAVLNALGLAAFNYDFRDDGDDTAELSASLRAFMCVHPSATFSSQIPNDVLISGPKDLGSLRTGKFSAKGL